MNSHIADPRIATAFAAFPDDVRDRLLGLRALIFGVAQDLPRVGPVRETLKWGQPSYNTPHTGMASPLRLGVPKTGGYAIYAHCQTSIISDFAAHHGHAFKTDGNRAVVFEAGQTPPEAPLRGLIRHALTYHARQHE